MELIRNREVLLADSVGLALLVVLDTLTPAERIAFVLARHFRCLVRTDRSRLSDVHRQQQDNWRVAPDAACRASPRFPRPNSEAIDKLSNRFSPHCVLVILTAWLLCSILM